MPNDGAPLPDEVVKINDYLSDARAQRIRGRVKWGLHNMDPELPKHQETADRLGVDVDVVRSAPEEAALAEKLPTIDRLKAHDRAEAEFLPALERTQFIMHYPEWYDESFSIWNATKNMGRWVGGTPVGNIALSGLDSLRTYASDAAAGVKSYFAQNATAPLGEVMDDAVRNGQYPSEDWEKERGIYNERYGDNANPSILVAGERVSAVVQHGTMGMLQSLDSVIAGEELARATGLDVADAGEESAERIAGLGIVGIEGKLDGKRMVLAAQLLATMQGQGGKFALANSALEVFTDERNAFYVHNFDRNLTDENGDAIPPEVWHLAGNAYGAIAAAIEMGLLQAQLKYLGGGVARVRGLVRGVVAEQMKKKSFQTALVEFGKAFVLAPVGEGVEETAQAGTEELLFNFTRMIGGQEVTNESLAEVIAMTLTPENLMRWAREEGSVGFAAGLGNVQVLGGGALRTYAASMEARAASVEERALKALSTHMVDSPLYGQKAVQKRISELVTMAGGRERVDTVYVDPDKLSEILEQEDLAADEVLEGLAGDIEQAAASESLVELSLGDVAVELAGTPLYDKMSPHMKLSKRAPSPAEAEARQQELAALTKETVEELDQPERVQFEESSRRLLDDVVLELEATGRRTQREAKEEALVLEGMYRSIAASLTRKQGEMVTPEQARQLKPVRIVGPDVEVSAEGATQAQISDDDILAQPEVVSAAMRLRDLTLTGSTHANALVDAVERGEIAEWDQALNGNLVITHNDGTEEVVEIVGHDEDLIGPGSLEGADGFVLDDGTFITRSQARERFGSGEAVELGEIGTPLAAQPEFRSASIQVEDPLTGEIQTFEGVTHADAYESALLSGAFQLVTSVADVNDLLDELVVSGPSETRVTSDGTTVRVTEGFNDTEGQFLDREAAGGIVAEGQGFQREKAAERGEPLAQPANEAPAEPENVSDHLLLVQRENRAQAARVRWFEGERERIASSAKKVARALRADGENATPEQVEEVRRGIEAYVRQEKLRHPSSEGWTQWVYDKSEPRKDDDGNVKRDRNGDVVFVHSPKKQAYTFDRDKKTNRALKGKSRNRAVRHLARKTHDEIRKVWARAKAGDPTAKLHLRQAKWYREMRARLRREFGGLGDLFADLLGGTSPQTPVRANWENAAEALAMASSGEFDALIDQWEQWVETIEAGEEALLQWIAEQRADGTTKTAVMESEQYKVLVADMRALRVLPDELNPRKRNGKKFGANGKQVVKVMVDLWRTVRRADPSVARGGTAPKAQNFSGNLIGFRERATIDVWAARFLQRLRWGTKIPSKAEGAVSGDALPGGATTGQFSFGQDVFSEAVELIRNDPDLKEVEGLSELNDDDLQAVVWFVEKEIWTIADATTGEGEGGSFEFEADLAGSTSFERIDELRRIATAKRSTLVEKAAAANELKQYERHLDRFNAGLSLETGEWLQGEDYVPVDGEMAIVSSRVREAIHAADPENTLVVGSKTASTVGLYGGVERSFDIEIVAREGYDTGNFRRAVFTEARDARQDSAFVSRVLRSTEDVDYTRHRPGIEVYFRDSKPMDEITPLLEQLSAILPSGYTVSVDARRSRGARRGEMPSVVGIRAQYIPEFEVRWGGDEAGASPLAGMTEEELAVHVQAQGDQMRLKVAEILADVKGVTFAGTLWHETEVRFEGDYDAALAEVRSDADPTGRGEPIDQAPRGEGFGRSVAQGVEDAARRALAVESAQERGASPFGRDALGQPVGDSVGDSVDAFNEGRLEQPAYHGGPRDHTGFSAEHIGSGEGAQAFGWGLYFSSSRGIAEFYRRNLADRSSAADTAIVDALLEALPADDESRVARNIRQVVRNSRASETAGSGRRAVAGILGTSQAFAGIRERVEGLFPGVDFSNVFEGREGQVFEVNLPEDSELMDWDAPIIGGVKATQRHVMAALDRSNSPVVWRVRETMRRMAAADEFWTGARLYQELTDAFLRKVKDDPNSIKVAERMASEALAAAGIKGHKYKAGQLSGGNQDATNFVIYDDAAIEIVNKLYSDALGDGGPRGEFFAASLFKDKTQGALIRLTRASDLSSFLHEAAHFYLETMRELVDDGLADDVLAGDLQTILEALDIESVDQLTQPYADGREFNGRVDKPHERFARMFEVYAAEGKAPSRKLEKAFAAFQRWMSHVYQTVRELSRTLGVELTPEVRGVFDRMLSTEIELEEVEAEVIPILPSDVLESMTTAERARWDEGEQDIRDESLRRAMGEAIRRVRAERRQERRELRESLRPQYEEQVDAEPRWQALNYLRGDMPEDERAAIPLPKGKIAKRAIVELYGENASRYIIEVLPRGTVQAADDGGIDPQSMAESFGYEGGGALLDDLRHAPTREQEINQRISKDIAARPEFQTEAIEAEVDSLVGGETLAKQFRRQLQLLRGLAGDTAVPAAERAVSSVGTPTAQESREALQRAQAALSEAETQGDPEAVAVAQANLAAAEQRSKEETSARRQAGQARRRIREIEQSIDSQIVRFNARQLVFGRPAGDLKGDRAVWVRRLKQANKAARNATARRDYGAAAEAVRRAAFLNEAIAAADETQNEVRKTLTYLRKQGKRKSREALRTAGVSREADLIDRTLEGYDLHEDVPIDPSLEGSSREAEIQRRKATRSARKRVSEEKRDEVARDLYMWAEDKRAELEVVDFDPQLLLRTDRKHWRDLSVSEFLGLGEAIRNIEHIARAEVKAANEALKMSFAEAAGESAVAILSRHKLLKESKSQNPSTYDRFVEGIQGFDSLMIKPERLLRWMGGEDARTNPLIKYLWDPWQKASEDENVMQREYTMAMREILTELRKGENGLDYASEIYVPELGRKLSRTDLMTFALNLGTDSNYFKLTEGYALDQDQVNAIIARLDDTEWDAIEQIWELVNSLWDPASQNHYEMTGHRPTKIERRTFVTPGGRVIKGDYFPVVYDPKRSKQAEVFEELADAQGMFGVYFGSPQTFTNWALERSETYAQPMLLSLDVAVNHMEKVIHDIAFRRTLRDTWKILNEPALKQSIEATFGRPYHDALKHRIKMMAGPSPEGGGNFKKVARWIGKARANTTIYAMGWAYSTSIAQLAGIPAAFVRISSNPLESAALLGRAVAVVANPATLMSTRETIFEKSKEMRFRSDNMDRDMRFALRQLQKEIGFVSNVKRSAFWATASADYIVSGTVWKARYDKVMDETNDEAFAIKEADYAVRRTQGAGNVKDLAQVQDLSPLARPLTMFYSYFSALYSEMHAIGEDVNSFKDLPKAVGQYVGIVIVPNLLAELFALRGPDDEDPEDTWLKWGLTRAITTPLSSIPVAREAANLIEARQRGIRADFSVTPIAGGFDSVWDLTTAILDAAEDGEWESVPIEAIPAAGFVFGVPVRQIDIFASNWERSVNEGGDRINWVDVLRRRKRL